MDDLYRDRIPNLPGYRKIFKQILLGIWGTSSLHADAELIAISLEMFSQFQMFENVYLQISNQNLFNVLGEDIAGKVRFEDISIIKDLVSANDYKILNELYSKPNVSFEELESLSNDVVDTRIAEEIQKAIELKNILKNVFYVQVPICFSLSNLGGTNHYSGMNYRIYSTNATQEYLLVDGGRIDSLVHCFNPTLNIPGVCMGVGVQVMAQIIQNLIPRKKQVRIIVNDADIREQLLEAIGLKDRLNASVLSEKYHFSLMQCKKVNPKVFFASEFYSEDVIIFFNKYGMNIRSDNQLDEQVIKEFLSNI